MLHVRLAGISPRASRSRPSVALLGICVLLVAVSVLVGCSTKYEWAFDVHGPSEPVEVGQTAILTVWEYSGGVREDATLSDPGVWDWFCDPQEGATCKAGRFTATEPGRYEVRIVRDSWAPLDLPFSTSPTYVTVVEAAASEVRYDNHNDQAVHNNGTPPTFEFEDMLTLLSIETYHWNDGAGMGEVGEISLQAEDGTVYGPYATEGREGQGGVPNAYWTAAPDVELPPGSYTVIDSDPSTWSQNSGSGGEGMVQMLVETDE